MATAKKKKRVSAKQKEAMRKARVQMIALVTLCVGIIVCGLVFVKGAGIWRFLHNALFGLFGFAAYLVPVVVIALAIITAMDKPSLTLGAKIWQSILLIFLICGAIQVFGWGSPMETGFFGKIKALYKGGTELSGGGVASALIGLPFLSMFGKTGAQITIVVLIVFIIMVLTGTTLKGLYIIASKPVKSLESTYAKKIMEKSENENKKAKIKIENNILEHNDKFNIDIPVDGPIKEVSEQKSNEEPVYNAENGEDIIINTMKSRVKKRREEKLEKEKQLAENMPMHPVISEKAVDDDYESPMDARDNLLNHTEESVTASLKPSDISSMTEENEKENCAVQKQCKHEEVCKEVTVNDQEEMKITAEPEEVPHTEEKENTESDYIDDIVTKAVLNEVENPFAESQNIYDDEVDDTEEKVVEVYNFPPLDLLTESESKDDENITEELKANAQKLVDTLQSFGVQTRVTEICRGPAVTRYELQPSAGVKISKITNLADDIALNLASAGVRIEAPIPNKAAVGIEVPNKVVSTVGIKEIIDSEEFTEAKSRLTVAMGKDIAGNITVADLSKMPHLLIAGATGSGKSVCINSIIISLLFKSSPEEVKLLMVDPKVVELGIYNGIPHLLVPVVTDPKKAAGALNWAVTEMLNRYKAFADNGVRDLKGYNKLCQNSDNPELKPMPQIVIIIDELADLMMAAPNEVEDAICRLAQMARAAGMHLVIATQRPSVDVITGVIKANIPSRIAFAVSSQVDSRTILDGSGAEKLLGRGDMLFHPVGMPKPTRVQGCFVSDQEVEKVVEYIKAKEKAADYDQKIIDEIDRQAAAEKGSKNSSGGGGFDDADEMLPQAIECVVEMGQASTSLLQRKLKLGYARAARIIDQLEERGIVGEFEGSKPRQVLITRDQWIEMKMREQ